MYANTFEKSKSGIFGYIADIKEILTKQISYTGDYNTPQTESNYRN